MTLRSRIEALEELLPSPSMATVPEHFGAPLVAFLNVKLNPDAALVMHSKVATMAACTGPSGPTQQALRAMSDAEIALLEEYLSSLVSNFESAK